MLAARAGLDWGGTMPNMIRCEAMSPMPIRHVRSPRHSLNLIELESWKREAEITHEDNAAALAHNAEQVAKIKSFMSALGITETIRRTPTGRGNLENVEVIAPGYVADLTRVYVTDDWFWFAMNAYTDMCAKLGGE